MNPEKLESRIFAVPLKWNNIDSVHVITLVFLTSIRLLNSELFLTNIFPKKLKIFMLKAFVPNFSVFIITTSNNLKAFY